MSSCVFCLDRIVGKSAGGYHGGKGRASRLKASSSCQLLTKQVSVMFIVRKLLGVSKDVCEFMVETFGHPSDWLGVCLDCRQVVEESEKIHGKIRELTQELEACQRAVKQKIVKSMIGSGGGGGRKLANVNEATMILRRTTVNDCSVYNVASMMKKEIDKDYHEDEEIVDGSASAYETDVANVETTQVEDEQEGIGTPADISDGEVEDRESLPDAADVYDDDIEPDLFPLESDASKSDIKAESGVSPSRKGAFLASSFQSKVKLRKLQLSRRTSSKIYTCNYCSFSTHSRRSFGVHLRVIHWESICTSDGITKIVKRCSLCSESFQNLNEFQQHCETDHGMTYKCEKCPRSFTEKSRLRQHYRKVHDMIPEESNPLLRVPVKKEKIYLPCPHCNYRAVSDYRLRGHLHDVHRDIEGFNSGSLICEKCDKEFNSLVELNDHKVSEHSMHRCDICKKLCLSIGYLELHKRKHHSIGGNWSRTKTKSFTNESGDVALRNGCKFCNERFKTFQQLKAHQIENHRKDLVKCDKCVEPRYFCSDYRLRKHNKDTHQEQSQEKQFVYKCELCDYRNRKLAQIRRHKQRVHEKNPRAICEICSFSFSTEKYLEYHKIKEHGEVNTSGVSTKCDYCNKLFTTPDYLQKHINTVHLGRYRFRCDQCGAGFVRQDQMEVHVKVKHLNILEVACSQVGCERRFGSRNRMLLHVRAAHSTDRNFTCSFCSKKFRDKSQLTRHEDIHRNKDINPHQCHQCGKSYAVLSYLLRHLKSHPKVKEEEPI